MNDFEAHELLQEMGAAMAAYAEANVAREPDEYEMSGECVRWLQSRLAGAAPVEAAKIPAGFKLVPIEPTDDMEVAFAEAWFSKVRPIDDCQMADAYRDMLAAAPAPEAQ